MDAADLVFAGMTRQAELVRSGEVSSRELVETCLERIERIDPLLNSFCRVMAESALAAADAADSRRSSGEDLPLLGVPIAVKDIVDVRGEVTTHGTACFDEPAGDDAHMVTRLRDAGAVILGKTTLPELAICGFTESMTFGATRNPWDTSRTPGGSSGGSGAAVAAGLVGVASASDGAGSIRIPATSCGLFGLKPQRGRIPMTPDPYVHDSEHWYGLSVNGVLTHTVADTATYLDITSGSVPGQWDSPPPPLRSFAESAATPPGRLRIAWSLKSPREITPAIKADEENRRGLEETLDLLRSLGHEVVEAAPDFGGVGDALTALYLAGARQDVRRTPHPERLESRTRGFARLGRPYAGRFGAAAKRAIPQHATRVNAFFDDHDVYVTLVSPVPPVEGGRWEGKGALRTVLGMSRVYPYTASWNLVGNPAASVPAGFTHDGLPLSVQIVGRPEDEGTLLSLAGQIEAERPWAGRRPPVA